MAWIFLVHVAEQIFGGPYFANPTDSWPPLSERVEQLAPVTGLGVWVAPANLTRWVGWLGDQGVSVFLIAAGFVLVPAVARPVERASLPRQWWYRLRTFLPMWWVTLALFLGAGLLVGSDRYQPFTVSSVLSVLGLRLRPADLYAGAPSWWYVTLLVQLALVAPFLVRVARRSNGVRALWWLLLACVAIRAVGLVAFDASSYLDPWSRGVIVVARLPEVIAGMLLALRARAHPAERPWGGVGSAGAALAAGVGFVASFTLVGNAVAPLLMGTGSFLLLHRGLDRPGARWLAPSSAVQLLGRHSLSVFLVHHPVVLAVIPAGVAFGGGALARTAAAVVLTAVLAVLVERVTRRSMRVGGTAVVRWGGARVVLAVAVSLAVAGAGLVAAEAVSRRLAPEELRGWGERPALEPSAAYGWRLRPGQETRLRWLTYDYVMESNELGFPGPLPPEERTPGVARVLVTGDAFTSGDGVEPEESWPRRLAASTGAEVLNFGMTGYGPSQESRVLADYVPRYQPDVIVVQLFVNDLFDVTVSDDEFRASIGFADRDPRGVWSYLAADNLEVLLRNRVVDPIKNRLLGREEWTEGWALGHFATLEHGAITGEMVASVADELRAVRRVAEENGAELVVVVVPASVQVCGPDDLPYWPDGIGLSPPRFDPDQPQRLLQAAADAAGIGEVHDLRAALTAPSCLYRKHNMHLTVEGQARLADAVEAILVERGLLP
jgi:peptidoglycan/LPS O-acetylase OafA/YrhL